MNNSGNDVTGILLGYTVRDLMFHSGPYERPRPAGTLVTVSAEAFESAQSLVRLRDAYRPGVSVRAPRSAVEPA